MSAELVNSLEGLRPTLRNLVNKDPLQNGFAGQVIYFKPWLYKKVVIDRNIDGFKLLIR